MIEEIEEHERGGGAQRGDVEAGEGKPARSGSKMRGAEVTMDGDVSGGEDGDKKRGGGRGKMREKERTRAVVEARERWLEWEGWRERRRGGRGWTGTCETNSSGCSEWSSNIPVGMCRVVVRRKGTGRRWRQGG